ncbi:MAG: CehA/McbA family metallohydrolase [Planctomycetota bacterium]|nr:CehA/McbA family metallohydrolase [Planctomycetota bacterium]
MLMHHATNLRNGIQPRWIARVLCTSFVWLFLTSAADAATRLEGRIVDDANGQPLAARVAVTDADGKFVEIHGRHEHVEYLGKRWCYVDGSFALTIPSDGISLEIRRGFETLPLTAKIAGQASNKKVEKTFRLRRWIDMGAKGYVNGDIHAHLPVPKVAHPQMRAEDLNTLTLLYLPDTESPIATNRCFTGKLDACSTPGCEIYVGQELQEWQMGHVALLGLTSLVPGYPHAGGSLEHWKSFPQWDLMRALRATREQNGTIFWSHISSLPGAELPVALALGLVDGVELITWSDPTQLPNHWGPWEDSGFSQAEFPVMRSMDLYYQFLNAGFRLPIAAGTDKFGEEIPLGSNRTYARVTGTPGYDSWLAAVKAGRSFVTNGPIVEFDVAGSEPGDVVEFQDHKQVKACARIRSILPINTVDIVMNGRKVAHKTVPLLRQDPPADGIYALEVEATVELTDSAWLAARVSDHPDLIHRILPRGLSVFAHTSPVYFLKEGRKVREAASIAYLQKYVQGTLHWLGTHPNFALEQDRHAARHAAEQALQFYKDL